MEIIRAKNSGFCFGVKQAIEATEKQIQINGDRNIYTCGPLIHNKLVTDSLYERGVGIINQAEEAKAGDIVIIRSHGETKEFYDRAARVGVEIVDATCPFVSKIHKLVNKAYKAGMKIVIVGDRTHPEVIGTNGWCENKAFIFGTPDDVDNVTFDCSRVFVVCQTTIKRELLEQVLDKLAEKNIEVTTHMATLEDNQAEMVRGELGQSKPAEPKQEQASGQEQHQGYRDHSVFPCFFHHHLAFSF